MIWFIFFIFFICFFTVGNFNLIGIKWILFCSWDDDILVRIWCLDDDAAIVLCWDDNRSRGDDYSGDGRLVRLDDTAAAVLCWNDNRSRDGGDDCLGDGDGDDSLDVYLFFLLFGSSNNYFSFFRKNLILLKSIIFNILT